LSWFVVVLVLLCCSRVDAVWFAEISDFTHMISLKPILVVLYMITNIKQERTVLNHKKKMFNYRYVPPRSCIYACVE
jgi:hypothetical protein